MRIPLITLLLFWLVAPAAADVAQNTLIDFFAKEGGVRTMDIAAATDGTLYAACHSDTGRSILNIYRSRNGGSSWKLWDQIESVFAEGRVHEAKLATTSADPGKLLVLWIDQRLNSAGSWVRLSRASVDDDVPVWSRIDPWFIFNLDVHDPVIDTISAGGFQDRVCIGWREDRRYFYANSDDSGVTFSPAIEVYDNTTWEGWVGFDLAADNNGVTHIAWRHVEFNPDTTRIQYRRAQWGGEVIGNWGPVQVLATATHTGYRGVSVAADPAVGGNGVIVAVGGSVPSDPPTTLYLSADQGLTWSVSAELDDMNSPVVDWGASGPVVVTGTFGTVEWDAARLLLTQNGTLWDTEILVTKDWSGNWSEPALDLNPAQGDAPMVCFTADFNYPDDSALWFQGTWRDAPGYGVPDPDYVYGSSTYNHTTPIFAGDLDGDGDQELVFAQDDSDGDDSWRVTFLDPEAGETIFSDFHMSSVSDLALLDLGYDDIAEAFYVDSTYGHLEGKEGDGADLPGFPRDLGLGDGPYYINGGQVGTSHYDYVVVAEGRTVHVLNQDGSEYASWPWTAPLAAGVINGRPAIGDVDYDGQTDLVIPFTERVVVMTGSGQLMHYFGEGEAAAGTPSLTDFDNDGDLEIVIPRSHGTIDVVHHDGTPAGAAWPFDTGIPGMPSQVALADIAGDDRRDLIFLDAGHTLRAITPAGVVVVEGEMDVPLSARIVDPVVAQIGPGEPAILFGGDDGMMRAITVNGAQEGWPRSDGKAVLASATVTDLNADGIVELIYPTEDNLWVLDMGVAHVDTLPLWPMSGADRGRTGRVDGGPIEVTAVSSLPAISSALHGAVPNPFNPMTSIRFTLGEPAAEVSLRVYDLAGRMVRTLHNGALNEGEHRMTWRGDDDRGRAMSSGVYLCQLTVDGRIETQRMALVR